MKLNISLKRMCLQGFFLSLFASSFGQSATCDTNLINAHLNPAGFTRLYVPNEPCSMYYYNPNPMYGINAHLQSIALGVPQLIINNAQENADVFNTLVSQGVFNTNYEVWMGITDSASTYTWRTFDGSPLPTYTNWASGEPNDASPTCQFLGSCAFCTGADQYWCAHGEDCAVLGGSGYWLDITCEGNTVTRIAVLEINTCPVTTPVSDTTICAGAPVSVSETVTSGGTAPYTYAWAPGGQSGQSVTIAPVATDTISIHVSDRFHCSVADTLTITVHPSPAISAGPDVQLCAGMMDTLGTTPDSNYTYVWTPASGLSSSTIANPIISNSGATALSTLYIAKAILGNCSSSDTVLVTLYPAINNHFTTATGVCVDDALAVTYAGIASGTANYNWDFDSATVLSGAGSGSYVLTWPVPGHRTISLSVTDHGCSDTPVSNTITVYPRPSASINPSGYTLTSSASAHYLWLLNGSPVSMDTTGTITATANGNYQVVITDSSGCSDTSSVYTVTGVGIADMADQSRIRIYPNPNNGSFIVETADAIGGEITVTDLLGRVIMKQSITMAHQPVEMNTQMIATGEYYISIRIEGQVYTSKIVIARE